MGTAFESDEAKPLWKDRRRRLGLPISFTRYEVSEDRFTLRKGFFRTETDEILLYRILDIKLVCSLWQKIFGVGTITLYSSDQSQPKLDLINIKKPDAVRKFLSKLIEQQRALKGITGREFLSYADSPDVDFTDKDGDGIPG